eukprot:TRINITY_DN12646_c0_g1_i1.p1 TRINITY_DN12646_c0_g1~~TRINITY_DN12646_c0_g1_i1.p1  ORF type:complete len:711 (+),score=248.84 TRINITY_DN12646_c0_g1_i1:261-2135(+)
MGEKIDLEKVEGEQKSLWNGKGEEENLELAIQMSEKSVQDAKREEEEKAIEMVKKFELEEKEKKEELEREEERLSKLDDEESIIKLTQLRKKRKEEEEKETMRLIKELEEAEERQRKKEKEETEKENERLVMLMLDEENNRRAEEVAPPNQKCTVCNEERELKKIFYLEACTHMFCRPCLRHEISAKMEALECSKLVCLDQDCKKGIVITDVKELLNPEEFKAFEAASTDETIEADPNMLRCPNPKCTFVMERVKSNGKHLDKVTNANGEKMSEEALKHRSQNRFRCRECSCDFCAECKKIPYHDGFTCEQFEDYGMSEKCRYCGKELTKANTLKGSNDICNAKECSEKKKFGCQKTLPCDHRCGGVKDEVKCLPCLQEDCCKEGKIESGQKGDDYCNICWVEDLNSSPSIMLKCGHIFHSECVKKKINKKWSGARITFGFLDCPLCKKPMDHESLKDELKPMLDLQADITEKAMARLKMYKDDDRPEFKDPNSQFYKSPEKYSLYKYSYFPCYKCKKSYFGGERACEAEVEFKPQDLICPGCCSGDQGKCKKHGTDFIEYKCKYCCKTAVWFCFGTTHFCDPCHGKAYQLPNEKKYPKCNCSREHPPNGQEYCFGCGLCNSLK